MADARERPLEHLWLLTTTFLHAAIRLYERWGFSIDPDAEADLHGTPLIRMDRPLG